MPRAVITSKGRGTWLLVGGLTLLSCSDQAEQNDVGSGGAAPSDVSTGGSAPGTGAAFSTGGSTGNGGRSFTGGNDSAGGASAVTGGRSSGGGTPNTGGDQHTGATLNTGGSGGIDPAAGGSTPAGGSGGAQVATWPLVNGVQWADTDGRPIQAHGGGMLKVGAHYYWFGENRNPDGTFFAVSAYRSTDLMNWEHAHDVLTMDSDPGLRPANVERPKVVYNDATGQYVMWMHWENGQHYGEARAAVASSATVDGDYTYHGSFRPYQDSGVVDHDKPGYMSRDCTLFVDDDNVAYFLSSSNENYDLHLYRLTPDYLTIESFEGKLFEGEHREAPALFKRNGVYFLVTSGSTGWDPNQAKYATSASLTTGWSSMRNVANNTTFYSQSTFVVPVTGADGTAYLYMGDRWAGAWGGRVNDSQYLWQPIAFSDDTTMTMEWYDTLQVDASAGKVTGAVHNFRLLNKKSDLLLAVDGSVENSAELIQMTSSDAEAAAWKLDYNAAGHFKLANAAGSGKVVDVPDEATDAGVDLHLWDDNGGTHQGWLVLDLGQGDYRLRNQKSGHFLGVADGSTEPGARIEQQTESGGAEQIWQLLVAE